MTKAQAKKLLSDFEAYLSKADYDIWWMSNRADEFIETLNFKVPKNAKQFTPPTVQEVRDFFRVNGYQEQVGITAWKYYTDGEWKDSYGKPVLSWKQKMRAVWMRPENLAKTDTSSQMIR